MTPRHDPDSSEPAPRGRRGGTTTISEHMVRKTFWIDKDVEELLRRDAFESGRSEAELVREALRRFYDVE